MAAWMQLSPGNELLGNGRSWLDHWPAGSQSTWSPHLLQAFEDRQAVLEVHSAQSNQEEAASQHQAGQVVPMFL